MFRDTKPADNQLIRIGLRERERIMFHITNCERKRERRKADTIATLP